jgi:hypothetical protein
MTAKPDWTTPMSDMLSVFREVNTEITAAVVQVFLCIASGRYSTQRELMDDLGLTDMRQARILHYLSDLEEPDRSNLGLISLGWPEEGSQELTVQLTSKGQELFDRLTQRVKLR